MSYAARLIHPLAIVSPGSPGSDDGYGQPAPGTPTVTQVNGLVQPKTAREIALVSQGGAPYSTHTIFLPSMRVSAGAYIRDDPDAGRRFDLVGEPRSFEYGSSPHLEVDVKLVGSSEGPTVPGS